MLFIDLLLIAAFLPSVALAKGNVEATSAYCGALHSGIVSDGKIDALDGTSTPIVVEPRMVNTAFTFKILPAQDYDEEDEDDYDGLNDLSGSTSAMSVYTVIFFIAPG